MSENIKLSTLNPKKVFLITFGIYMIIGMHFFMHGGHGKHKSVRDEEDAQPGGGKKPGGHGH